MIFQVFFIIAHFARKPSISEQKCRKNHPKAAKKRLWRVVLGGGGAKQNSARCPKGNGGTVRSHWRQNRRNESVGALKEGSAQKRTGGTLLCTACSWCDGRDSPSCGYLNFRRAASHPCKFRTAAPKKLPRSSPSCCYLNFRRAFACLKIQNSGAKNSSLFPPQAAVGIFATGGAPSFCPRPRSGLRRKALRKKRTGGTRKCTACSWCDGRDSNPRPTGS